MSDDDVVRGFIAHENAVLNHRAAMVGVVTSALRGSEGWRNAGDGERRTFAQRAQFSKWLIGQGRLTDARPDTGDGDGRGW